VLVALFAACDSKPKATLEAAPGPELPQPKVTLAEADTGEWRDRARFELGATPTTVYRSSEPVVGTSRDLERKTAQFAPDLQVSQCLSRAAELYASYHPFEPKVSPPRAFVEGTLQWAGCPDSSAAVRLYYTTEDDTSGLLEHLETALTQDARFTHYGVGRARGGGDPYRWTWAIFLVVRNFDMAPFPRQVGLGDQQRLEFRLGEGLTAPSVLSMAPGGSIDPVEVQENGETWSANILFDQPGVHWVEVLAEGVLGPEVVIQLPVYVNQALPTAWEGFVPPDEDWIEAEADAEALMLTLVNRDRAQFGLPELQLDETLRQAARAHSADMRDHQFFAHISPTRGGLSDRLSPFGYQARIVAENIARNPRIYDAESGLMESLGHRANILSARLTHLGIGAVLGRGPAGERAWFLTQEFALPIERPSDESLRRHVSDTLIRSRTEAGAAPLRRRGDLDRIAQRAAEVAARSGFDGDKLNALISADLEREGIRYRRFRIQYQPVLELVDFLVPPFIAEPQLTEHGIGVDVRFEGDVEMSGTLLLFLEH